MALAFELIPGPSFWKKLAMLALASGSATEAHAADSGASETRDAPSKSECIEAHRLSQEAQNEHHLVKARQWAMTCTNAACPGLLVADCARWLGDIDQRIPSVVFDVRANGHPNLKAQVFADDELVQGWTRGEALSLDPGKHVFRFVLSPFPSSTQTVLLGEGMRYRVVSFEFTTPSTGHTHPTPPPDRGRGDGTSRPVPALVYPLLAVGALGLGGFVGFAMSGKAEQNNLENTCSPRCTDSDLSTMRQRYLIGDLSLIVGVASLVGASVVYLLRPQRPARSTTGLAPQTGNGSMTLSEYRF